MIEIFGKEGKIKSKEIEKKAWISLTNPSEKEIQTVVEETGVLEEFLRASLDPEESSRIDKEDDQVLIIINAAHEDISEENTVYVTIPVGIIILKDHIITVTLEKVNCIEYFKTKRKMNIDYSLKTRFTLQIIGQMANQYILSLRKLDDKTIRIEKSLEESPENEKLIELLAIEKTIVYFITSLSGNEKLMKKLFRTQFLKRYEDDEDLIEDTLIELQQALEMANTNQSILKSVRDAFSSVINNNLNVTMRTLASITVLLTIPVFVTSFFGMNINFGTIIQDHPMFVYLISVITGFTTVAIYYFMKKKKLF